jgi:hypothetical protein
VTANAWLEWIRRVVRRYVVPTLLDALAAAGTLYHSGGGMQHPELMLWRNLAAEAEERARAERPCAGHPERMSRHVPPSRTERRLWRQLGDLARDTGPR